MFDTMPTGEDFSLKITTTKQVRLNNSAASDLLTELLEAGKITKAQHEACFNEITFPVYRFTRLDKSKVRVFDLPDLGNATPEGLIDQLGHLKEEANRVTKKLEGVLKTKLVTMLPEDIQKTATPSQDKEKTWAEMSSHERFRSLPGRTMEEKFEYLNSHPELKNVPEPDSDDEDDDIPEWAR